MGLNFQVAVPKVSPRVRATHARLTILLSVQTQQLQMLPMSQPNVNPGATETQQMRIMTPVGVSLHHEDYRPVSDRPFSTEYRQIADTDIVFSWRAGDTGSSRLRRLPA